jgi:hypothetical protein
MKVSVISDLHLEFDGKPLLTLPGGDVLLLAGDVAVAAYLAPNRTDKDARRHRKVCDAFFREECAKYKKVYYILGNHEHYHGVFDNTADHMREFLAGTNVTLLNNEFVDLGDWNLFGGTLWTDYNDNDWFAKEAAKNGLTDHHVIRKMRNGGKIFGNFMPDDAYEVHRETVKILEEGLYDYTRVDKPTVVMTHHAPTALSIHPRYVGDVLNWAYYTDLHNVILDHPNVKYWFHGHMHDNHDYMVGDNCRVVCNPRGYMPHDLNPDFNVDFYIEV